jgi:hypothetical protein
MVKPHDLRSHPGTGLFPAHILPKGSLQGVLWKVNKIVARFCILNSSLATSSGEFKFKSPFFWGQGIGDFALCVKGKVVALRSFGPFDELPSTLLSVCDSARRRK